MADNRSSHKTLSDDQARAQLAAIVDSSDDAILSKTPDGIVTTWNKGAERLYGYSAAEAVGRHISFLVPEGRREELQRFTERVLSGGRVESLETVRITKDGKEVWVSLTLSPIFDDETVVGVSTIARDITERRRMEHSLKESEKRYRTLVELAPDGVVVHRDGRLVYANCAALGIFGARSLKELQEVSLLDLVHVEDRRYVVERVSQLLDGEEIPLREFRLLRLNGEEVSVEASSTLIDYQGRPSIQIIARDITERKRMEQERERMLKEIAFERIRFEVVVRQMPVGVMIVEAPSGRLLYDNEESRRIFGWEIPEVAGPADYHVWPLFRADGSRLKGEEYPIARALRGETVIGEELGLQRGDGSRGYVSVNSIPIFDASGELVAALAVFNDVTTRKEAETARLDSEQRLNLALEAAEMGFCDMDIASGNGLWSQRHFQLLGYPAPTGTGAASTEMWLTRILPEDREEVERSLERARRERSIFRSEHRVARVDNQQVLWVSVMGRFLCDQEGALCRFIGVICDITERKKAEEALRQSECILRQMADSMPQIVWTATGDGSIDYLNAKFESYTGLARDEKLLSTLESTYQLIGLVVHPDDVDHCSEAWQKAIESGEPFQAEFRVRCRDGAYHWVLGRAVPERDEAGRVVKWYGTSTDINDLREVQEQLRASEMKFRWLFESNIIAIFFWKKDGWVPEANQAFCDLLGIAPDDCRQGRLNWRQVTSPQSTPRDLAAVDEILASGSCKPYEKEFVHQDGHLVPVLMAGAHMVGSAAEGIGFAVDLTDLKRAEEALKTSEATLKLAIETAQLGIFDWDLRSDRHDWSAIAKAHYGLPAEVEITHQLLMSVVHPEDRSHLEKAIGDAFTSKGGLFNAEYRTVGPTDHKVRWLTSRGKVTYDDNGEPLRMVGACMEITEIVEAEKALKDEIVERLRTVEELRKQEQLLIRQGRLAAMGEMIGNIAHQWRQPLNTLGLIVQELPRMYQRDLFNKEYLDSSAARAMQVINYMSKTIDGFRNFFGPDKEKESFRVGEVLAKTVSIVEAAFKELNLAIEVEADQELEVYGYPNEFSQVVLNILVNAKDAILERKVERPRVSVRLFRENEKTVMTIADNAGGIAADIIERIFDPYFTTKGPDKGTGIGLFMSKTIIEKNMNGSLTARNTEEGAEFRIEV